MDFYNNEDRLEIVLSNNELIFIKDKTKELKFNCRYLNSNYLNSMGEDKEIIRSIMENEMNLMVCILIDENYDKCVDIWLKNMYIMG